MPEFRAYNSKCLVRKKKVPRRVFATLQENEYMFATKTNFMTLLLVPLPKMKIHESGEAALQ